MAETLAGKSVVSLAGWINTVLVTGLTIAGGVVVTKFCAGSTFKIPGTDVLVGTAHVWILFLPFTLAHLYVALLFIRACRYLFRHDRDNARKVWEELSLEGPLFFRGIMPRLLPLGRNIARMRRDDLTTWLAHVGAIAFWVAMSPIPQGPALTYAAATALTFINWTIGSNWVIAASELTSDPDVARIL